MTKKKSCYNILFERLYEYYEANGDNDNTWHTIMKDTKDFITKLLNSSSLYRDFYDEGKQDVWIAIMNAFRTYNKNRDASLYTWVTLLCRQAIWRRIKDITKYVPIDYMADIEIDDACCVEGIDPESVLLNKEYEAREESIKQKLSKLLGGPIEVEVFAMMHGLFGYDKMKIDQIAEEAQLSKKTIYGINMRNNKALRPYRNDRSLVSDILK